MKKHVGVMIVSLLFCLPLQAQQGDFEHPFYYYKGEKINLQVDYSHISIVSEGLFEDVDGSIPGMTIKQQRKSYAKQNVVSFSNKGISSQNAELFLSEIELINQINETEYAKIIQNIKTKEGVIHVAPSYAIGDGKLGLSNNFYVKLLDINDTAILYGLANQYAMDILGYNEFMPLWITVSCTKETSLNALEAANLFYENQLFANVEPEFLYHDLLLSPNDPFYPFQF
jgi:hypothetical protein